MDAARALAAEAVAILARYVAGAGAHLAKPSRFEQEARALLETLKARWAADPVASDALSRFEKNPEVHAPVLQEIFEERLQTDNQLRDDLARTVQEQGPAVEVFLRFAKGENITGADIGECAGGEASVNIRTSELNRGGSGSLEARKKG